ncbi:DNA polymerase alpha/epsilon subunit B-domain-containing protein [Gigaspora margarita]|uniref:DNA-directed DNA polymerase n=1 Tax=Gigaspora margarita TaxID=4874 RepID=A0A8H4AB19_GIGMA|nr:DNA polymerase alpha/epsilon subunit B-domain-containing protein [Gigaspora margarita]
MDKSQISRVLPASMAPKRVEVIYNDMPTLNDELLIKEKIFRQYANLYYVRLLGLRTSVLNAAQKKWESILKPNTADTVNKILDVKFGVTCCIIGTVYMEMRLKPNILDDVTKEHWAPPSPPRQKYCNDDDEFFLEDESGRIKLIGGILKQENIVTGVIMAVLGKESSEGNFEVFDICFAGLPYQQPMPVITDDKYIALISGMNIGPNSSPALQLQMMTEFLNGELGDSFEQNLASKIALMIVAGNSLQEVKVIEDDKKEKKYGYDSSSYNAQPLFDLDNILNEICSEVLPVDLMPGSNDPVNAFLPQQPIIPSLLPKAYQNSTFRRVTNPYWCEIDGVVFLGTSGQTIDDIAKYVESEDRLKLTEQTLYWRHIAPTTPDTLWCHPFRDYDPFIMKQTPHVYFVGNQKEFATTIIKGPEQQSIRLISLPSFSETGNIVLVNLKNLDCHTMSFSSTL